jgi:hypothetical protein
MAVHPQARKRRGGAVMTYSIKRGRLSKRRTFSVFDDLEGVSVSNKRTGEPAPDDAMGRMQVECVFYEGKDPEKATPIGIYVVMNGERIAYRGREGGIPAWISMKEGVNFHNGIGAPGSEALQ